MFKQKLLNYEQFLNIIVKNYSILSLHKSIDNFIRSKIQLIANSFNINLKTN